MDNLSGLFSEKSLALFSSMYRDVFQVDNNQHIVHLQNAQQQILAGTSKWSAKLAITVVSAQGLIAKDKTGIEQFFSADLRDGCRTKIVCDQFLT